MPQALLIDDDARALDALAELVEREGFTVRKAGTLADGRQRVAEAMPDAVILDLMLPDGSGLDLLQEFGGATEIVLVTGHASVETAVDALRMGAADYLTKPIDIARLKTVLANISRRCAMKSEIRTLREELRKLGRFGAMIGSSPPMLALFDLIAKVATTDATVLITGESGTGKELVAETIHRLSRRMTGPFVAVNCGAIPANLIESELFGHERGAFTGAERRHRGVFERAGGGTLFLDEVTEMPIELQVKLLRALETGTVTRLGGERPIGTDVRVLAASNRPPEDAVSDGRLREDLYYRLNVFPVRLPPLRERSNDIHMLAEHFLHQINEAEGSTKRLSADAVEALRQHNWPGNVRELKNTIRRAHILADELIDGTALPIDARRGGGAAPADDAPGPVVRVRVGTSVADAERRLILATLDEVHGDKQQAATMLGMSLKTLYNRLNAYRAGGEPEAAAAAEGAATTGESPG